MHAPLRTGRHMSFVHYPDADVVLSGGQGRNLVVTLQRAKYRFLPVVQVKVGMVTSGARHDRVGQRDRRAGIKRGARGRRGDGDCGIISRACR